MNDNKVKPKFMGLADSEEIPYKSVIDKMRKIQFEYVPLEKFKILTKAVLEIRNCAISFTGGKKEICGTDEELPILMFVTIHGKLENFCAELGIISDYLKFFNNMDAESQILTNFMVSQ